MLQSKPVAAPDVQPPTPNTNANHNLSPENLNPPHAQPQNQGQHQGPDEYSNDGRGEYKNQARARLANDDVHWHDLFVAAFTATGDAHTAILQADLAVKLLAERLVDLRAEQIRDQTREHAKNEQTKAQAAAERVTERAVPDEIVGANDKIVAPGSRGSPAGLAATGPQHRASGS